MDVPKPYVALAWLIPIALLVAGTPVASQGSEGPTLPTVPKPAGVELAHTLAALAEDADKSIRDASRFVRSVTETLAGVRDLVLTAADDPGHGTPSSAIAYLYDRVGNPGGADPHLLDQLDALPELLQLAILDIFNAYIAFDEAARGLPAAERRGELWDPISLQVLAARNTLLEAVVTFAETQQGLEEELGLNAPILMPPVFAYDPIGEDSRYYDDYLLIIDVGGNDLYFNNAGGSGMRPVDNVYWNIDPCVIGEPMKNRIGFEGAAALIDLGGDDRYGMYRACGVNGGGNAGAGFLFDQAGRDRYRVGESNHCQMFHLSGSQYGSCGVNGGGYRGGIGFLMDYGSDWEIYEGTNGGVNGGGYVGGMGFLFDMGGHDKYWATSAGVNGGGHAGGFGFLFEASGSDYYEGTFAGVNGGGDGGIGNLIDLWGQDVYIGTHQGVNGGAKAAFATVFRPLGFRNADFLPGRGLLYDVYGHDIYQAERSGVNGGGDVRLGGLGLLLDENGRDTYFDYEGGAGIDTTLVPKGTGAQLDRESHQLPVI